jgi:iron(III) transport system permease protein
MLLGVTSAVVATGAGFLLAFSVARTTMPGKTFVHGVALLPIISPPFVMALAVVILFGRSGLITRELLGIRNANVYGFHSLVLIQSLAFTPIAYLNIRGMLQSIDSALEDASASLGGIALDDLFARHAAARDAGHPQFHPSRVRQVRGGFRQSDADRR